MTGAVECSHSSFGPDAVTCRGPSLAWIANEPVVSENAMYVDGDETTGAQGKAGSPDSRIPLLLRSPKMIPSARYGSPSQFSRYTYWLLPRAMYTRSLSVSPSMSWKYEEKNASSAGELIGKVD